MAHPVHPRDRFENDRGPRSRRAARRPRPTSGPWKHGSIPVVGLIGGIGAGKSLAAGFFANRGAFVIDADTVGHHLLDQRPSRDRVLERFGTRVLGTVAETDSPAAEGPRINRKALGAIVFEDPTARRDLESILHPRMRRTFEKAIARTARRGQHNAVLLDAAVLIEAGWDDLCDLIVFIDAPRALRQSRLAASRGWTAEMVARREAAQLPLEVKRRRADAVLKNTEDAERLDESVGRFWDRHIAPVPRAGRS